MGCDGGTIPKRDELVRQKKKAEVKDKNAAHMATWRYCALKHNALKQPIVADSYGILYNKDTILEYLLDRAQFEHGPTYIKKLKDVKELQLTENPSFKSNNKDLGNEYLDVYSSPFICQLTGLEMNGKYKFCAIWTCGCVLSDRALRSVNKNHHTEEKMSCPRCGQEYLSNDDVIILNPEDEDLILMDQRRQRLAANQKKNNGSHKRKSPEAETETNGKKTKTGKYYVITQLLSEGEVCRIKNQVLKLNENYTHSSLIFHMLKTQNLLKVPMHRRESKGYIM